MTKPAEQISNETRAIWAEAALHAYRCSKGEKAKDFTPEESVIDLLTDLRHYCKREGLDFEHLSNITYSHYCEEDGE